MQQRFSRHCMRAICRMHSGALLISAVVCKDFRDIRVRARKASRVPIVASSVNFLHHRLSQISLPQMDINHATDENVQLLTTQASRCRSIPVSMRYWGLPWIASTTREQTRNARCPKALSTLLHEARRVFCESPCRFSRQMLQHSSARCRWSFCGKGLVVTGSSRAIRFSDTSSVKLPANASVEMQPQKAVSRMVEPFECQNMQA
jgi:hypothetical protein